MLSKRLGWISATAALTALLVLTAALITPSPSESAPPGWLVHGPSLTCEMITGSDGFMCAEWFDSAAQVGHCCVREVDVAAASLDDCVLQINAANTP